MSFSIFPKYKLLNSVLICLGLFFTIFPYNVMEKNLVFYVSSTFVSCNIFSKKYFILSITVFKNFLLKCQMPHSYIMYCIIQVFYQS